MEDIILESARLIAADDESKEIIKRLRSEGVYSQEDNEWQLMNMVFVSSAEGVENIPNVLSEDTPAKRNVIININPSLEIDNDVNYDSILSFFNDADIYEEIKELLCFIRTNVEMNRLKGLDENEFFVLTKGRKMISTHSYSYNAHIDEAIDKIKKLKLQDNGKYLLLFTIQHDDSEGVAMKILSVGNLLDTFPENATVCWNVYESSVKQIALFAAIPI